MIKIGLEQHYKELEECKHILDEIKKTADTNGAYCPYNKTYPCQANVVHEIRKILSSKIEK